MPKNVNSKDQAYKYPFVCADILSNSAKLADALFIVKPAEASDSEEEQADAQNETTAVTAGDKEDSVSAPTQEEDSADPESKAIQKVLQKVGSLINQSSLFIIYRLRRSLRLELREKKSRLLLRTSTKLSSKKMTKMTLIATSNIWRKIRPKRKPALLSLTSKRTAKMMKKMKLMLMRKMTMTRRILSTNPISQSRSPRASLVSIFSLLQLVFFQMSTLSTSSFLMNYSAFLIMASMKKAPNLFCADISIKLSMLCLEK
jgi:hypothetical protein